MTKYPAPAPPYLGPPSKTSGTRNKPINRIVIHSTVSPCKPGGARNIASYFRSSSAGGSAHYVVDPAEVIQSAYDSVVCWHAPPNPHSLGIEMCDNPAPNPGTEGGSRWKALRRSWRWVNPNQMRMLNRTAKLTAELCLAYDVPIVWLSAKQLRAGKHGITSHANVSAAWRQSTHWDPGYWPRYGFMTRVKAYAKKIQKPVKKTPTKPSRVLVSKNLKGSRGRTRAGRAAIEADLRALTKDAPLVVALQEVPGALGCIRRVMGKQYKRLGGGGSTRMYVHHTAKIRRDGTVRFRTPWTGPQGGKHLGRTWPCGLVESDKKLLDILDVHQVWSRARNRKAWDAGLDKVVAYVHNHPQVDRLLTGDWNMPPDHPDAKKLAHRLGGTIIRTGADVCWAIYVPARKGSDHGRRLAPRGSDTPKRGSDHQGFRIDGI